MDQITFTLDSQKQQQMERYCALSGVSQRKALDEMWDIWVKLVYIPWSQNPDKNKRYHDSSDMEWFDKMRARAEKGETPDLSMEEIIDEIKRIRAERRSTFRQHP